MNIWNLFCPSCGGPKTKNAKRCKDCFSNRKRRKRGKRRTKNPIKSWHGSIPTEVTLFDGSVILTRSKLEADWLIALESCSPCYECLQMSIPQKGRKGDFIGNYTPDLVIEGDKVTVYLELKPTRDLAKEDPRPARALLRNPTALFLVLGGYPGKPFYVKMLSGDGEKEFDDIELPQLMELLGCGII